MSRTISLDIKLDLQEKLTVISLLEALVSSGLNPIINDTINCLPIDDNEMYNWTKIKGCISELYDIVSVKEKDNEVIGVDLYWNNTDVGVTLLIFNPHDISFSIDINVKYFDQKTQLIDFNWYSSKILLALNDAFNVTQYTFSFIY